MKRNISIVWFRQDLRLADNLALAEAAKFGTILPIFILDDCAPKSFRIGGASKLWLHHSLQSLNQSLDNKLNFYLGSASEIISNLIETYNIQNIFWNTTFEYWHLKQEAEVVKICNRHKVNYKSFNSNYLWHPNTILKDDASYYKVFTAYKKKSYNYSPRKLIKSPNKLQLIKDSKNKLNLQKLNLITNRSWEKKIGKLCKAGEFSAKNKLSYFIKNKLAAYKQERDYPVKDHTSNLSPHLHFGEISPVQIWEYIQTKGSIYAQDKDIEHFCSELIWREFSCYLMYHFNKINLNNFNSKFNNFAWSKNIKLLRAWQQGKTGYPIVDAGMRQLWQTGIMHNRVRMVVASFLVKNLNIHWHYGQAWFWDCLLDADLANNSASWQWVAGCGADAAPYFRIFNPVTQGEKFDKTGEYTKKFVPELKNLPDKYLFCPWKAPKEVLAAAGVNLGINYPNPIVDLASSRERALKMYREL